MHHPEIVELIISRIILQTESILLNHLNEFTKFHNQNFKKHHWAKNTRYVSFKFWWLGRVTLVVVFGFLSKKFGKWPELSMNDGCTQKWMQLQYWGQSYLVGTLKPYLLQNNLFELYALSSSGDTKTLTLALGPGR